MDSLAAFLHMGGYAGFVWPAYALTVVVMAGVLVASLRAVSVHEGELERLQRLRPQRRRAAGPAQTEGVDR